MRPVDLLPQLPHLFYDGMFDQLTGAPLLIINDYTWTATATPANAPIYNFFRGGLTWNNAEPPVVGAGVLLTPRNASPGPIAMAPNTPAVLRAPVYPLAPPLNLAIPDRNNANLQIHTQIYRVQWRGPVNNMVRIRVGVPALDACGLVSAYDNGNWNGVAPAAIPLAVRNQLYTQVTHGISVRLADDPPGAWYGYRGAVVDLRSNLGAYCSYCESRVQDARHTDVEHRLPKSFYTSDSLDWDNFLLACARCNRDYKGANPSRSFGIAQAIADFYPGAPVVFGGGNNAPVIPATGAPVRYDQMRSACLMAYAWPSMNDTAALAAAGAPPPANAAAPANYSLLAYAYRMEAYNAAGVLQRVISMADATDPRNSRIGPGPNGSGLVQANIWDSTALPPVLAPVFVRVVVNDRAPATGTAFDADKQQAAARTIPMTGLNNFNGTFGDNRVVARTEAWLTAVVQLRLLQNQLALVNRINGAWYNRFMQLLGYPPPAALPNDAWDAIAQCAELSGYYSIWLTVFKARSAANPANNFVLQLAATLQARTVNGGEFTYQGTSFNNSVRDLLPNL